MNKLYIYFHTEVKITSIKEERKGENVRGGVVGMNTLHEKGKVNHWGVYRPQSGGQTERNRRRVNKKNRCAKA